jgi:phage baseplate assembly protein W
MPIERVSKSFKDISMSFQTNPLNSDIIALKNENAIARSIRNIVFTMQGEKFFDNIFGSGVKKLLFDNIDEITALSIKDEIENSIINYEPRVELIDVISSPDYDNNGIDITIIYRIIGADVQPQQLEFVLLPNR